MTRCGPFQSASQCDLSWFRGKFSVSNMGTPPSSFVILSVWNNGMRLRMQHLSFHNSAISRETRSNRQGMAEQEVRVVVVDSIPEGQQPCTASIQIFYHLKKKPSG